MTIRPLRSIVAGQSPLIVTRDTTVTEAALHMRKLNKGAVLVVDNGRLVGIFTERDALFRVMAEKRDPATTSVGSVMTRDPQTIHPDQPFVEALRVMHEGRFRHLPVVEHGRPLGMVSSRNAMAPELMKLREDLDLLDVDRE
jgi:CBS domain-containing protein